MRLISAAGRLPLPRTGCKATRTPPMVAMGFLRSVLAACFTALVVDAVFMLTHFYLARPRSQAADGHSPSFKYKSHMSVTSAVQNGMSDAEAKHRRLPHRRQPLPERPAGRLFRSTLDRRMQTEALLS